MENVRFSLLNLINFSNARTLKMLIFFRASIEDFLHWSDLTCVLEDINESEMTPMTSIVLMISLSVSDECKQNFPSKMIIKPQIIIEA